jgi:hypothetical protein
MERYVFTSSMDQGRSGELFSPVSTFSLELAGVYYKSQMIYI